MSSHNRGDTFQTIATGINSWSINNPQLLAANGALHMYFQRGFPLGDIGYPEILYRRSTDWGYTWSEPDTLSTNDSINSQLPRLAGDNQGNLYMIWNDQKYGGDFSGTILMRRSTDNGLTWIPEQIVSQKAVAVYCDVAVQDSFVAVVWETDSTTSWSIDTRLSRDNSVTWCGINSVAYPPGRNTGGDPTISLSNYSMNLCWQNDVDTVALSKSL